MEIEISLNSVLLSICICLLSYHFFISKRRQESSYAPSKLQRLKTPSTETYKDIYRIVITGGPCAGKTTAMQHISSKVSSLGFQVFIVPEAATLLMKGGAMINLEGIDETSQMEFQANLMQLQMVLEDTFTEVAGYTREKSLILCDRGLMDGSAYIDPGLWQALLDEYGWTAVHLRDRRYEGVIHMVTAADGADGFYTLESNVARYEGLEQAKEIDTKLKNAWVGHPYFAIIDNSTSNFDTKIKSCVNQVLRYLGYPVTVLHDRKFLIEKAIDEDFPIVPGALKVISEESYLVSTKRHIEKIEKRGHSSSYTYSHKVKTINPDGSSSIAKCQITSLEYISLMKKVDSRRAIIHKLSQYFIHNNIYMKVDTLLNIREGITFLQFNTEKDVSNIDMPVKVSRDIKDEAEFSQANLSRKKWYATKSRRIVRLLST